MLISRSGVPIAADEPQLCGACQQVKPAFHRALAYGPYEGALRNLVHLLKYERVASAAKPLGKHLAEALANQQWGGRPLLVPVPLHKSKFRLRGFNQAEEIGKVAQKYLKLELNAHALVRRRATASQTGMTSNQRQENVKGAFAVRNKYLEHVAHRNIILIDDVYTTGATANECARVLRRAGAAQVWVATVARVTKMNSGNGNNIAESSSVFEQDEIENEIVFRQGVSAGD